MKFALLLLALLATGAQAAPARLTEAEVRTFVARESKAWNARDVSGYFALFTRDARFTDQALARDGRVVPYGTSTLEQAREQVRRSLASSTVHEAATVSAVVISADGRSARVTAAADTTISGAARPRRVCAQRVMVVVATPEGLRSKGQTDTVVRCR